MNGVTMDLLISVRTALDASPPVVKRVATSGAAFSASSA
jgi:hypothetical protein